MQLDDIHPTTLDGLKSLARRLKKVERLTQAEALDRAATQAGFATYAQARKALETAAPNAPTTAFVSAHWHNPVTGQGGGYAYEVELAAPLAAVLGRAPFAEVTAFQNVAAVASDHLRGTRAYPAPWQAEVHAGMTAAALRELDAGRPLVRNEYGLLVVSDREAQKDLEGRRTSRRAPIESPAERDGVVALLPTDSRPAALCPRQESIAWEEDGRTWLRSSTLVPRSVHRKIANLVSPFFDRLPKEHATALYGALLNLTDTQRHWLEAEDRAQGFATDPGLLEPELDRSQREAQTARILRAAVHHGSTEIVLRVTESRTEIGQVRGDQLRDLGIMSLAEGKAVIQAMLEVASARTTETGTQQVQEGEILAESGLLPPDLARSTLTLTTRSNGLGELVVRLTYVPATERSVEAHARRAMREVRALLARHVPDCAARDRFMKLSREVEEVARLEAEGKLGFPPEADGDWGEVPQEKIEELRAEMEQRYGIGQGRIREIDEPAP